MFKDSPETASVFVITPAGEEPGKQELETAAKLSYARVFAAREMCPRIGSCVVHVYCEVVAPTDALNQVDSYQVACEFDCPLLIDEPVSAVDSDS